MRRTDPDRGTGWTTQQLSHCFDHIKRGTNTAFVIHSDTMRYHCIGRMVYLLHQDLYRDLQDGTFIDKRGNVRFGNGAHLHLVTTRQVAQYTLAGWRGWVEVDHTVFERGVTTMDELDRAMDYVRHINARHSDIKADIR